MDNHVGTEVNPEMEIKYPLLPGEKLLHVIDHEIRIHPENPSSVQQLLRLTRANHIDEIGKTGLAIAALPMSSETKLEIEDPEHLRLYDAEFARDALRVAQDLIPIYPDLARATILTLARNQGVVSNISREEEEGRIFHEDRNPQSKKARELTAERGWGWPYYGSVDSTSEFIRTLAAYSFFQPTNSEILNETYTDRLGKERTIAHTLNKGLEWIAGRRSQNPEGLIESKSPLPGGIENQVWKDSWDAYHHADGTLANRNQGVSSVEVQVSAYEALLDAAELYEKIIGDETRAAALRIQAGELHDAIFEHYWTEDKGGYFVLGTDRDENGNLRQLKIRTSNMGHTLNSRILTGDDPEIVRKRTAVVNQILSPELWCEAGIRSLASDEVRFRPGAYQNGSVWLWDTHFIANGLRRHRYDEVADTIDANLIKIANKTGLFPEYVRGDQIGISLNQKTIILWDENAKRENTVEQPPQEVQAWTVAAVRASKHRAGKRALNPNE